MSSTSSSPTPPKGSVRSIINIFENQTFTVNNEPTNLIRRTKSMVNLSYTRPIKTATERIEPDQNLELIQIEQQIQHLQNKLSNNYKTYSRENHIYYQNQIIFILTDLANVETKNNPQSIDRKSELTEILKRLNKKLNVVLPSDGEEVVTTEQVQVVTKTPKYDKFGRRSKSIDEKKPEVKTNKKEPVFIKQKSEEKIEKPEKVHKVQKIEKVEQEVHKIEKIEKLEKLAIQRNEEIEKEREKQKEDEVDSAVSVRSLKEIFEKNTNENEGKVEFGMSKISRKFLTFNSASDFKYVPYSQKFKTQDQELNGRESPIEKQNSLEEQNSFDSETFLEHTSDTVWKVTPASDDENGGEKRDGLLRDSLKKNSSDSSSGDESDSEETAKEDLEGEVD